MEVWAPHGEGPGTTTRERTEVLAVVRDDMRTPLLGLEALVDALADGSQSPEVTERMHGHSRVLARRVSLLVEDLALVANTSADTLPLTLRVLELDHQLAECAASFPDMVIHVAGETGLLVRGDALRIQQICANLMRSAQRTGGRPVTIRVSGEADFVTLRVTDAGPRDGYELSIVNRLVEAHGGVAVHEVGGSFVFTLPRALGQAAVRA
jgi:signal transduction histidine kinase